jgi:hypothetical protein
MISALSTLSKLESSVVWVFSILPLSREAIVVSDSGHHGPKR